MALDREDIGGWVAKLQRISDRFSEVEKRVSDPEVASDQAAFASLMMEHRRLKPMAAKANVLVANLQHWDEAASLASSDDEEMKAMAASELLRLTEVLEQGVERPNGCCSPMMTPTTEMPSWRCVRGQAATKRRCLQVIWCVCI